MMNLNKYLSQKGLVVGGHDAKYINSAIKGKDKINLLYGETYDFEGITIDSLKYYLFSSNLSRILTQNGHQSKSTILVADTATCRNEPENMSSKIMKLGEKRADFIKNKVNEIYNTNLKVLKMSEYINSDSFKETLKSVREKCTESPEIMDLVTKTVPEDKLEIEKKKKFQYSFEEISTIYYLDLNIKVGPPREKLYDQIVNEITSEDKSFVYLYKTFPLNVNFDFYINHSIIEKWGLTPYKGGSKGMEDHRIILGKTKEEDLVSLVNSSFINKNKKAANPILDLAIIGEMARQNLEKDFTPIKIWDEFYSGKLSEDDLKELAIKNVKNYVLNYFN